QRGPMLPDIRLLVVAVLAAIAGISCGLGLFATFRVNHEPLLRFSEGGPPLPLALDNRTAPEIGFPIAARLSVNAAAKPISAPVLIPPPPAANSSQAGTGLGSGLVSRLGSRLGPPNPTRAAAPNNSEAASLGAPEDGSIATTPATSVIQNSETQPEAESATTSERQVRAVVSNVAVAVANEAAVDKTGDERSVGEDQPPAAK